MASQFKICITLAYFAVSWLGAIAVAADAMPVSVVRIVNAPIIEELNLTGSLRAKRIANLSSEVEGLVKTLYVDDGDRVETGDAIVDLDDELARIAKSNAAAIIAEAEARVADAQRRLRELEELASRQHVPKTNVEAARAEIEISKANLAQANANARRAQALLERHYVRAPFSGVVGRKLVEVGQWVETSSQLIELVETQNLRLEAPVPQFYFTRVETGTEVAIRFDALPDQIIDARITTVIPVSNPSARTFPVRVDLDNKDGLLAPGMSARVLVKIQDPSKPTALVVPQDAIVRRPDGSETVWVVEIEDGVAKAAPRVVQSGRTFRNVVEIESAELAAGDAVVVRGNEILRKGQAIAIAEELAFDI